VKQKSVSAPPPCPGIFRLQICGNVFKYLLFEGSLALGVSLFGVDNNALQLFFLL
jgi:hypothetical protein